MDIILIIFAGVILISCRFKNEQGDYLNLAKCNCLRGIMAVAIVLHHMSEKTHGGIAFPQLQHIGYLIVAVFFFLSGYGLTVSYSKKGIAYFRGFWRKRIGYLAVVYLLVTALYWVYFIATGRSITVGGCFDPL